MSNVLLEMRHITKVFSGVKALDDVNLTVKEGEIHALCGENGAGKSTLMNVLSGVYPFGSYSGDIMFQGKECRFHDIKASENEGIVIIHQELALSPYLSIAENVFIGNEQTKIGSVIDWNRTRKHSADLLKEVGLEHENINTRIMDIGVGKQQLVEIAKALSKKVKLLILDEPTAALNDEESYKLLLLLKKLQKQGITSIMISHKLNEISQVADVITVIRDGQVIETIERGTEPINEDRIIKGMVGRELTNRYPDRELKIGDVVFEVSNLNVYHPQEADRKVINNVNINVRRGEVVGLAGLMGAGRTELAMSIFGRSYGQKISGAVYKDGKQIDMHTISNAVDNGIAYVTEDRKTYGLVLINDIKWNMSLASLRSFANKNGVINKNEEILAAHEYRAKINVKSNSIEQTVGSLSGGNQQKVVLAKWILTHPDILILDEPTRGIDVGAKYEIYCVINQLIAEGKSIIIISSEMSEVLGMADRVYVVNEGEIAGELTREEASQEAIMKCIMSHQKGGQ
jgi:putative multiple sugar transport system ATP-binding protein